jgi:hypothetical protein
MFQNAHRFLLCSSSILSATFPKKSANGYSRITRLPWNNLGVEPRPAEFAPEIIAGNRGFVADNGEPRAWFDVLLNAAFERTPIGQIRGATLLCFSFPLLRRNGEVLSGSAQFGGFQPG